MSTSALVVGAVLGWGIVFVVMVLFAASGERGEARTHRDEVRKALADETNRPRVENALCAIMNNAAGEIVNGADRHEVADALLSPAAVRHWIEVDDEECERAARVEAERDEAREHARQLRDALEAVLRFPPGGVDDDEVPELRGQGVEMWARARATLDASHALDSGS